MDAPPAAGKTTAIPTVAADTGDPITYLTQRRDLYQQMRDLCADAGLDYETIPAPHRDCPTFDGEHGDGWAKQVKNLYERGVPGWCIHRELDPPCEPECPYLQQWQDIRSGSHDVLIGNPQHAYAESVVENRVVIVDEFPADEFITHFEEPGPVVSAFLRSEGLGYDDYTDLLANRTGVSAVEYFMSEDVPLRPDPNQALDTDDGHAQAPILTLGVAIARDLGNGFESTRGYVDEATDEIGTPPLSLYEPWRDVLGDRVLARNRDTGDVWLLDPPDLSSASSVVGLDGTPTMALWNKVFADRFDRRQILTEDKWPRYLDNVLDITIVETNTSVKPYSSGEYVTAEKDTKIAFFIWLHEQEKPGLITSTKAIREYEQHNDGEILEYIDDVVTFANVRSTNDFEDKQVGYVCGSRHYGDDYIKRWGALAGFSVEDNGERGLDRSYGPYGDMIQAHVRRETLQDVLRFGRDDEPAIVYVNTCVLPDWVPIGGTDRWRKFPATRREVASHLIDRVETGCGGTVAGIIDETGVSETQVRDSLDEFVENGFVTKHAGIGRNGADVYVWNGY